MLHTFMALRDIRSYPAHQRFEEPFLLQERVCLLDLAAKFEMPSMSLKQSNTSHMWNGAVYK